ncbi:hypothetical protein AG0111_0g9440 [Alternaria gaisen]|uniref:Uncharacterized protein n=1 Tax=Alternaria gaisen TaxID=167740 RepID=A0ACB6FBV1_9PLEO|nr:hypothetical protein AG0111_0g9440 [Alternaria gaisen]
MSPSTHSPGPLPPSLFSIYRTYKRETSTVIGWLISFDKTADNSKDDQNPILQELTVRQIADRARNAASIGIRPPKDIEAAFKMVIVFNETQAEAYRLLFPKLKQSKENSKKIPGEPPNLSSKSCANSFGALAELIEVEEEFDVPAYELWREDATIPDAKSSVINEDSIGNFMALQTWIAESQAIIETTNSIWASFATGDLTLSAAGWLTNMAQHWVRHMDFPNNCDFSKTLFFSIKKRTSGPTGSTVRPAVTLEDLEVADFGKIATDSSFAELAHGCGLFQTFLNRGPAGSRVTSVALPKSEWSRKASHNLSQRCPERENEKEIAAICDERYNHDGILLASLVKGASRHPLSEGYNLKYPSLGWDPKHIEHALAVPFLCELKGEGVHGKTIVAAHMLLESGRSFVHEFEKIGKPPLNCRILVLRRANEVLDAIQDLIRGRTFEKSTVDLVLLLRNKLRVFVSNKTFDIYTQSPWVAGSQMSRISDFSIYIGLEILDEKHCFGAVIHLYNMLQHILAEYAEIPILEHLKTLFRSKVFACNQEPRRGFGNTLQLFRGDGKIYQRPEINFRVIAEDRRRKPDHEKVKCSKFSLLRMSLAAHESFLGGYAFRPEFTHRLAVDPKVHRRCARTGPAELFDSYPPSDLVQRAREVLRSEYDDTFPMARLNCFAVLRLCQDIMFGIAARFEALGSAAWPTGMESRDRPGYSQDIKGLEIDYAIDCVHRTMRLVDGG